MSDQLSARDWVDQGLKALASRGFTALKAEPLAKALRVSRGSFYWHFADIAAFHAAILARWHEVAAEQIIANVEAASKDEDPLALLLRRVFGERLTLERAVRTWAARRSRRPGRRAGHRPAAAELCGEPSDAIRIIRRSGPRPRANSLLGVSRLCVVGPAIAESAATGRARRTGADRRVMTRAAISNMLRTAA